MSTWNFANGRSYVGSIFSLLAEVSCFAMGKGKRAGRRAQYMVFVSHATSDKWIARSLCEKIESAGAQTFRDDRDIDGGDDIPEAIRVAIKRSRELVVLLTPRSIEREWVKLEVGAAWGWRKDFRIIAVLYHVDVGVIPAMIKGRKAIDLNDFDDYLRELKARIKKHRQ